LIHVTVFDVDSNEIINFDKCYSPFDFGYIVLQAGPITAEQQDDLDFPTGPNATRNNKSTVLTGVGTTGYVSIRATRIFGSQNGTCGSEDPFSVSVDIPDPQDLVVSGYPYPLSLPLATWAIVVDIGAGFFGTEIPTATARVSPFDGVVSGGIGAFGLIPAGNEVISRYDVNPAQDENTLIFVWLAHPDGVFTGWLDCEDELEVSTPVPLLDEVNVLELNSHLPNTSTFKGPLSFCINEGQYRGVLRFTMPDTGFLWSHITQENAHFRENFLGYNLQNNGFIDCADGVNDFGGSAYFLCPYSADMVE
jgi:hypothetical protein